MRFTRFVKRLVKLRSFAAGHCDATETTGHCV